MEGVDRHTAAFIADAHIHYMGFHNGRSILQTPWGYSAGILSFWDRINERTGIGTIGLRRSGRNEEPTTYLGRFVWLEINESPGVPVRMRARDLPGL